MAEMQVARMTDSVASLNLSEQRRGAALTGIERESELAQTPTETIEGDIGPAEPKADRSGALTDLLLLSRVMMGDRRSWPILRLSLAIIAVLIGNMIGQIRLNRWNGAFFDAIEKRNTDAFVHQIGVFLVIIAALLVL